MTGSQRFTLELGDCIELLKALPTASVDLVLTDPPYNISRANNFASIGRSGIDFGEWDKNADILGYIAEVRRVLTTDGSFVVFNDWKNLGDIVRHAETLGFSTKDMLRLEKTNPMPRNRDRRYITDFECAVWFTMPKAKWTFNRQSESYQRPKFVCPVDKGLHPTQKSLKLMTELVQIHSNPGDVVCDPFMGSGTTGVAAMNTGRRFIGFELDTKYFTIASERVESAATSQQQSAV